MYHGIGGLRINEDAGISPGRIQYVIGAYFIGVGTLFLLALVGIIPAGPSQLSA